MSTFKSLRLELKATQQEVANYLACTQANVSLYDRGQTVPPEVARIFIAFAKTKGRDLSFDEIYAPPAAKKHPGCQCESPLSAAETIAKEQ